MSDVKSYALVKDSIVVNCVLWDGSGDIFSDSTPVDNTSLLADVGDAYVNETLYPMPRDGYTYAFSTDSLSWTITAASAAEKAAAEAAANLVAASSEYTRASDEITSLQEQIDDADYTGDETEATVTASKALWVTYRKSLRAYITAADGTATIPVAPDATAS